MRAQLLHGYGEVDQFRLDTVAVPDPQAGEVRLRVRAIGINPMDVKFRTGSLQDQMPITFPALLGTDVAGVVDQLGAGVTEIAAGDRVSGLASTGAYAEMCIARADHLAQIPEALDFARAATIPTAVETAQRVIKLLLPQAGETVVVNGAAGSVGSAAVQLLVRGGAEVIATASEVNHDYLRSLGATPTRYGAGVENRIRELAPNGVDAVFDVSGQGFADTAISLRSGSDRIVTVADFAAGERGITVSLGDAASIRSSDFAFAFELAAVGEFATEIDQTFTFEQLPAAHELSGKGHVCGKIIVSGPQ